MKFYYVLLRFEKLKTIKVLLCQGSADPIFLVKGCSIGHNSAPEALMHLHTTLSHVRYITQTEPTWLLCN